MVCFEKYDWKPQVCQTVKQINEALEKLGVIGKKIKCVHVIGEARELEALELERNAFQALINYGFKLEDVNSGKYPLDDVPFPYKVSLCEPVVIVFEDNSTLEIKPDRARPDKPWGLLMTANQISPTAVDGLNHSNFDSEAMFRRAFGCSITEAFAEETTTETLYCDGCDFPVKSVTWSFLTDGEISLYFHQKWSDSFQFGMEVGSFLKSDSSITCSELKKIANGRIQIVIDEGHNGGSDFWIMPVRYTDKQSCEPEELCEHEISIEEDYVYEFLHVFLEKYFDYDYDYGDLRSEGSQYGFQWNLEYNFYTYESMEKMLDEIEYYANLLKCDYDNPLLDELKSRFKYSSFGGDGFVSEKEEKRFVRENIGVAIDFYERFVRRMRRMMKEAEDGDFISFMGP